LTDNDIEPVIKRISAADNIIISGHVNPDGDSIGSLLGLGLGLEALGKRVYMLSPEGVPAKYRGLPGASRIKKGVNKIKKTDLAIAVDCSNKEILGRAFTAFERAGFVIEIDHHNFRRPFGDIRLLDTKAAAVGEMIYELLGKLSVKITEDIALNLLTSILVETNSFKLPTVRPVTFEICADLVKTGVDFYNLTETIFWSRSRESIILSGICMARCKFLMAGRIVWSIINKDDFNSVGGKDEDVDSIADEMRSIKGVKIAILFRGRDGKNLRVSLRSKNKINVAAIAESYNGGGHYDVAGCSIPKSKRAIASLLVRAKDLLK